MICLNIKTIDFKKISWVLQNERDCQTIISRWLQEMTKRFFSIGNPFSSRLSTFYCINILNKVCPDSMHMRGDSIGLKLYFWSHFPSISDRVSILLKSFSQVLNKLNHQFSTEIIINYKNCKSRISDWKVFLPRSNKSK